VVWMFCIIQGIFMLCVVSVVIAMVISTDIGTHDIVDCDFVFHGT
jgi:hypothetical protein